MSSVGGIGGGNEWKVSEQKPINSKDILKNDNVLSDSEKKNSEILLSGGKGEQNDTKIISKDNPLKSELPNDILKKIASHNPASIVDEIRNSKGPDRDKALMDFQGKLDKMSEKDLKIVRDYLVKEMANPDNKDDQLLGALAERVNKEIDSRDKNSLQSIDIDGILNKKISNKEIGQLGGSVQQSSQTDSQKAVQK